MTATRVDLFLTPGWEDRHCRDADPEGFYQGEREHWQSARRRLTVTAEFFCRSCPLLSACREAGAGDIWGMWGGLVWNRDQRSKKGTVIDLLTPERQRAG